MFNVLKGEMSFVGPRPERPFFISALNDKIPYYPLRFSVKPGLTGWAQVSYPYGDSEQDAIEKLQYDLYYMKYMSPMFDLQILFETVKVILVGRGAQ
jgi:lipopolysaccharide/colanic/teichoic acid biosynthesis glycosyltransferase